MDPDEIEQLLDQIQGTSSGLREPVVVPTPTASGNGGGTTLQDVLRANGTVTSIVNLPQSESDSLAAIMGESTREPLLRYWFANGKYVDVGAQTSGVYRGTALGVLGKATAAPSAPTVRQGPGGIQYQWNPETNEWIPAPGIPAPAQSDDYLTPSTSAPYLLRRLPDGTIEQVPNPNYTPPRAPQPTPRQPRWPEEIEESRLRIQKAQQDLLDPFTLQQQQAEKAIEAIRSRWAAGDINATEANRLMGLTKTNLESAILGTSPWQMQQEQQRRKEQQQDMARAVLADQLRTSSGMATGLLSGLSDIFSKVLSSSNPPTDFDPLAMAKTFTQDVAGGSEINNLAKALLTTGLRGGI